MTIDSTIRCNQHYSTPVLPGLSKNGDVSVLTRHNTDTNMGYGLDHLHFTLGHGTKMKMAKGESILSL